jgi:hypothetical protein
MRTLKAKAAFVLVAIVVADGGFLILHLLHARPELIVLHLMITCTAIGLGIGVFWEFSEEPPRWVQRQEARRKARQSHH